MLVHTNFVEKLGSILLDDYPFGPLRNDYINV